MLGHRHFGYGRETYASRLYLCSVLSIVGSVCVWKGVWTLLEVYILPASAWSEVACVVVGFGLLAATRALVNQGGVVDSASSLMVTI
jgi:hypothetical protein